MTDEPTKTLPHGFGHLFLPNTRTPEEREAAAQKELARRKGRGRKDWWKASAQGPVMAAGDTLKPTNAESEHGQAEDRTGRDAG